MKSRPEDSLWHRIYAALQANKINKVALWGSVSGHPVSVELDTEDFAHKIEEMVEDNERCNSGDCN